MSADERKAFGPYEVDHRLATGGMAEVFVARRIGPHGFFKRVALKRILPQYATDTDFVAMFIDEARLAASLSHPNIVQVFDFGDAEGELFIAMELVEGTTVNKLLRAVSGKHEAVPVDVALHIASQTSHALAYAHRGHDELGHPREVIHRDVSPANILLTKTGHVKLSDFGIARVAAADHRTGDGNVRGKLGYMSPEQVMGKSLDGRSDVFTLATVLAEMLIAEPLFGKGADIDVLLRIRDADMSVLDKSSKRIPQDVRAVIKLGLARDPKDRPDAHTFAEAIDQILRRRSSTHSSERLARLLARLELVDSDRLPTLSDSGARPTGLVDTTGITSETDTISPEMSGASPAIYRVQLRTGEEMGPIGFPKVVEMVAVGKIDRDTLVSRESGSFQAAAVFPELVRFLSSPAMQWNEDETSKSTARGEITAGKLVQIVYRIAAQRDTGVLHLVDGERRKKVYFIDGRPDFVASNDQQELLGEYLIATGLCLKMEVDMALAMLPRYGGRLGDALVGMGVLRPVELVRAVAAQVKARYLEAFRWRQGEWFWVSGARSNEETFPLGLDALELLRDASMATHPEELEAALAEVREQVLSLIPTPAHPVAAFRMPERWQKVLESIRGDATLGGLLARETMRPGVDAEDVYHAVFIGLACGLVKAQTLSELS